jgi:hypothetical protein
MVTRRDEEAVFRSAIEWPHMRPREEFDIGPGPMPMKFGEVVQAAVVTIAETAIINPHCESPIEAILGGQLKIKLQQAFPNLKFMRCSQSEYGGHGSDCLLLIPQFKWDRYRFDFAVAGPFVDRELVFIECDGAEFHSTPEQQARDQEKTATADKAGIPVFRFSGSQIHRDAAGCAANVAAALMQSGLRTGSSVAELRRRLEHAQRGRAANDEA